MKPVFAILITVLFCQALFAEDPKPVIDFPNHHLCLEATGKVVVKADKAVFSFSCHGYGATLRAAVDNSKKKVTEITNALNQLGIGNENFSTGSFTSGRSLNSSFLTDKKDYQATLSTSVTLKDLSKLDEAILILIDKKVDYFSSIDYAVDNETEIRQRARETALNRICEQRDTITRILGVNITDVLLIDEAPFERLPWEPENVYNNNYNNYYTNSKELHIRGGRSNEINYSIDGLSAGEYLEDKGGMYTPDITVEHKVRVLYRIGYTQTK